MRSKREECGYLSWTEEVPYLILLTGRDGREDCPVDGDDVGVRGGHDGPDLRLTLVDLQGLTLARHGGLDGLPLLDAPAAAGGADSDGRQHRPVRHRDELPENMEVGDNSGANVYGSFFLFSEGSSNLDTSDP